MRVLVILLLQIGLHAQSYEDRFYKDIEHHPSQIAIHSDIGYSTYLVEFHSSELNSAIDYDILEFTLGGSYSYDNWLWGIYCKFVIDELKSNMDVVSTGESLKDHADIDKNEFGIYANYTLDYNDKERWSINFIYRYAELDAKDSYPSYLSYKSLFEYKNKGLALSFIYNQILTRYSSFFLNVGAVYSHVKVEIGESIENRLQDSYVNDNSSNLGMKISVGYNYKLLSNLFCNVRLDRWQSDFSNLEVTSRVGDSLPNGTLREELFTFSTGLTWKFERNGL